LVAVLLIPAMGHAVTTFWHEALARAMTGQLRAGWWTELTRSLLELTVPVLIAAAAAAFFVGAVQARGSFAAGRLAPDLARLDPVAGFGRLFQLERTFQVLRSFTVVLIVGWLSYELVRRHLPDLVATVGALPAAAGLGTWLARKLLAYAVFGALLLAAVDFVVVHRSWLRRLRMTKDEIKREHREAEGDPQLKQERRRAHQQMLQSATLHAVKGATVVIINPSHFATALFYDEEETAAPRVVASGQDVLARQMIDAARAYGVPVVRDVPVAQALHQLEVGDEIPEVLYEAVAEILRQVLQQPDPND
jgi:flagellar biosynthesis protein FlhB